MSRGNIPHFAICKESTLRLVALSSTISTRRPASAGCWPVKSRRLRCGSSTTGARIVKWNVDPLPSPSLVTHMLPPINSASRLLMASPRPVPPYLRVVEESACENDWNNRPICSLDSPIPVSRTLKWSSTSPSATGEEVTLSTTSPCSVNFTEFASRLSMTCRSRVTSLLIPSGISPSNRYARSRLFSAARGPTNSSADSTHSRRSSGCTSTSMRPASIFEKSKMSLMMVNNASPLSRMVVA